MRKCYVVLVLGISLTLAGARDVRAQDESQTASTISVVDSSRIQVIKVLSGSTIIGRVNRVAGDSVEVETAGGRMTLARSSIVSVTVRPASAIRDGEYWVQNPNTSRLLFGPTGQMLKKGDGYVAGFELFFLGGAYGVTENITVGGGVLIPAPSTVYFLTPKIGFSPSPNLHLAAGAMLIGVTEGSEPIGVYYGASTFGETDQSITAGIGYGFSGSDVASEPVFMFGGEKRVSNRLAFVTENYLVRGIDPLMGFGIRFIGEKLSADLGVMRIGDSGHSNTIPLINFMAKF